MFPTYVSKITITVFVHAMLNLAGAGGSNDGKQTFLIKQMIDNVFPWRTPEMIIPFLSISKQKFRNSAYYQRHFKLKRIKESPSRVYKAKKKYQKCVGDSVNCRFKLKEKWRRL